MKATILHESRGRMRIRVEKFRMSCAEADLLQTWLECEPWAKTIDVHERTCCVIITYHPGKRNEVLKSIKRFSWDVANEEVAVPLHSGRELNREFQEKLVGKICMKLFSMLLLPKSIQTVRMVKHMIPFMKKGLMSIRSRHLNVDLLDAISIGISAGRKDFGTASAVMFLLEISELLEEWTRKRSIDDLARCMSLNVDRVWLRTESGEDILTPISQIEPGDKIIVRIGGVIPTDGTIIEGEIMVNQASLTGESIPVAKRIGGTVYAGTVIEEGECIIEVKQASGESRYDKIVTMIEESQQLKSATENKASQLADHLVPYTFLGSILSFALTGNISKGLSVLMVDFSCALKLAMPLAVLSAMRESGRQHITVKGGKFLEAVANADTIVFDKTGTLTYACPRVVDVISFGGNDETEMLRLAACLEEHFPHSLANAVVEEAKDRNIIHEEFHTKVEYIVAHGIASTVEGEKVVIGSAHFVFEDEGCTIPDDEREKYENISDEYSHLYLAKGGKLVAIICIADPLRDEATPVLQALHQLGIKNTVMLTGDNYRTAKSIASQVGVDQFRAEVLPADKAHFVAEMRQQGHTVIMVGDGINDSPALSEADAGIAISHGAAIAREISDITIPADSLWELVKLRQLSMELMHRIKSNYRFVIGFNSSLIVLGVAGILQPAMSATLHNLSTLALSIHSMCSLPIPNKLYPEEKSEI